MSWDSTLDQDGGGRGANGPLVTALPGLLLLFSDGKPELATVPFDRAITVGRGALGHSEVKIEDGRVSRRHAEVLLAGQRFTVRDLGSRNGTFVDGEPVAGEVSGEHLSLLRVGQTLLALVPNLRPFLRRRPEWQGELLLGPRLVDAWERVAQAGRRGESLHIVGESGTGKELAARHYHASGPRRSGPFVPVNCAAIPQSIAERLLFGARRGAYSGADSDADGYVQAAHGGTLFLDEVAELDLQVQAKLLRVLESREVLPLGASQARKVDIALCSATHRSLRALVADGRFREDLYFRLGRPSVQLPPLRERLEDVPFIAARELSRLSAPRPDVTLMERLMLARWPGNVRELLVEVRAAAAEAERVGSPVVDEMHLGPDAGDRPGVTQPLRPIHAGPRAAADSGSRAVIVDPDDTEAVRTALRAQLGNVSRAARALGWHRTQLRRWLARQGLEARSFAPAGARPDEDPGD